MAVLASRMGAKSKSGQRRVKMVCLSYWFNPHMTQVQARGLQISVTQNLGQSIKVASLSNVTYGKVMAKCVEAAPGISMNAYTIT